MICHNLRAMFSGALVAAALLFSPGAALAQSVLIVGAPGNTAWNTEVAAKLQADGRFTTVDVVNGSTSTPSVATLQTYDSVLVYNDIDFSDNTALGDNLHAYLLSGGGVVNAVFETEFNPLGGAWATNADSAVVSSSFGGSQATLGAVALPGHPVMAGVVSFDGGTSSYRGNGGLTAGSTLIASWSTGEILAATKTVSSGTVVSLNFFPPSSDSRIDFWQASTDGDLLMANALAFAADSVAAPVVVPTLTEWAMILMALALGVLAVLTLSRRRQFA